MSPQIGWGFEFRGLDSGTLELDIYDVIGEGMFFRGVTAKDVRRQLRHSGNVKTIKVRINSGGGDVIDGFAIYSLLQEHDADIQVQVDGLAASMASVIAMAGDTVVAAPGSFVMIHNPWGLGVGESDDLRNLADTLDKMRDNIVDAYMAKTGLKRARLIDMMDAETWMKASEAKSLGFVDKVLSPSKDKKKKSRAAASLQAYASAGRFNDFGNVPEELSLAHFPKLSHTVPDGISSNVSFPNDSQTTLPLDLGSQTTPAESRDDKQNKEKQMNIALIMSALALSADASEDAAVGAIKKLEAGSKLGSKVETLTGKEGDEAYGTLAAWKESHEKLPAIETKMAEQEAQHEATELDALIKQGREDNKLTKAEADKLRGQVEGYRAARSEGKEPEGDEMSLAAAKSFVSAMSPKPHLSGAGAPEGGDVIRSSSGLEQGGKAYEELTYSERAELKEEDPTLWNAMSKDWKKRGEPEASSATP